MMDICNFRTNFNFIVKTCEKGQDFIFFENALNTTNNSKLHKKSFFEIKVGRKINSTEEHFITNNKFSATFFLHSFSVLKFTPTSVQLCTLLVDSILITQTNSKNTVEHPSI